MPLSITTFIREKTGVRNSLYARHPELWDFCRISVHRNWIQDVPEISHPSETLAVDCDLWSRNRYLMAWDRGLLRRTRAVAPAAFWKHSAEIGWQASPWEATFHHSHCLALQLDRALPARSAGHSHLSLVPRNPFSLEQEPANSRLLTGSDADTLDAVEPQVAAFWDLPLKTEQYYADWSLLAEVPYRALRSCEKIGLRVRSAGGNAYFTRLKATASPSRT